MVVQVLNRPFVLPELEMELAELGRCAMWFVLRM
jgi:hypothetical protein